MGVVAMVATVVLAFVIGWLVRAWTMPTPRVRIEPVIDDTYADRQLARLSKLLGADVALRSERDPIRGRPSWRVMVREESIAAPSGWIWSETTTPCASTRLALEWAVKQGEQAVARAALMNPDGRR